MSADGLPPGLALSWGVTPGPRRGPKPAHTVTDIVATAISLADDAGVAGLSLPRLAERVGVTASGLYRYVRSKDELLVIMTDTAWGDPPPAVRRARSWRSAAAAWTRGLIAQLHVHPWLLDIPIRSAPSTPNALRWLETFVAAMAQAELPPDEALSCALLLDGYARSTVRLTRQLSSVVDEVTAEADAVVRFLEPRLTAEEFPVLAELLGGGYLVQAEENEIDAEFGLQRILDGIAVLVDGRAASRTARRSSGRSRR